MVVAIAVAVVVGTIVGVVVVADDFIGAPDDAALPVVVASRRIQTNLILTLIFN